MAAIANDLHANTVRIEGEDISRLVSATEVAHAIGLKVFFNPWKMNADAGETISYMKEAAKAAEALRKKGIDLTFVAGCEYTIFSKGAFPGDTFNERLQWMVSKMGGNPNFADATADMSAGSARLNVILESVCKGVRQNFHGLLTYAAGTWEKVNWNLFDIVGIDYYRQGESAEQYVEGLNKFRVSKPLVVMEVGSCTYKGAAARGAEGFAILQGINPDGTGIFEGGKVPVRSESEQADYVETQVKLLKDADVDAIFIFLFSFPIMPLGEGAKDRDMTSFSLVKTFPKEDPRSQLMPPWKPKEAFYRLAEIYRSMATEK